MKLIFLKPLKPLLKVNKSLEWNKNQKEEVEEKILKKILIQLEKRNYSLKLKQNIKKYQIESKENKKIINSKNKKQ